MTEEQERHYLLELEREIREWEETASQLRVLVRWRIDHMGAHPAVMPLDLDAYVRALVGHEEGGLPLTVTVPIWLARARTILNHFRATLAVYVLYIRGRGVVDRPPRE